MWASSITAVWAVWSVVGVAVAVAYQQRHDGLSEALLLREMVARMGSGLADPAAEYLPLQQGMDSPSRSLKESLYERGLSTDEMNLREALELSATRDLRDGLGLSIPRDIRDDLELGLGGREEEEGVGVPYGDELAMHPSLRDREYMSHGHLLGDMFAQFPPGSSYGTMRTKPSGGGSPSATSERKTDGVLPAYCNPPNPCPIGYTASDGCEEEFENTAAFSRNYQAEQECMCDTEHMFDCPDSNRDSEIGALARSIQNEGVLDSTLDKIMDEMRRNPFLQGEKLPVAAKKGVLFP
uniref:Neuroendocrine protein 7B2 n=1 Tax=Hirondellea gigas TaxID=1518452 RepID=A0A6A7G8L7_9CRUS